MRMPAVAVGVVHQGGAVPLRRVVPQAAHEVCSVFSLATRHVPVVTLAHAALPPLPHRPVLALLVLPLRVSPLPTPRLIVARPPPVVKRFTCLVALTSNHRIVLINLAVFEAARFFR